MKQIPNFERLKDAHAIIDGIPATQFALNRVITRIGETHDCGTLACAAGWLGLHPTFLGKYKPELQDMLGGLYRMSWGRGIGSDVYEAMSLHFNISRIDSLRLFGPRCMTDCSSGLSDKSIWKRRIQEFLATYGQLGKRKARP